MADSAVIHEKSSSSNSPNVFPASQYLQERLEQRRSRNARPRRSRQSDFGPQPVAARDDDIFVKEGDSLQTRSRRDKSSLGARQSNCAIPDFGIGKESSAQIRGAGGARQLNEQLDRLTKLNFDLKLEIDHRRAHQVKLNAELERMRVVADRAENLAAEHAELLKINGQLVEELEKRDKAMQEAVDIICDLEERMVELEDDKQSVARASTTHADSGYAGTETLEASSFSSPGTSRQPKPGHRINVPAAASGPLNIALNSGLEAKTNRREPSFMVKSDTNTHNLRSVYHETHTQLRPIKSFHSILSRHTSTILDDEDHHALPNSPRLSSLSQSSFPSIYASKDETPVRHKWEPEDMPMPTLVTAARGLHTRQDSISRVSQWIEGNDVNQHAASSRDGSSAQTLSPSPVIPAERQNGLQSHEHTSLERTMLGTFADEVHFGPNVAHDISRRSSRTPTSFGGPIFGEPIRSQRSDSVDLDLVRAATLTNNDGTKSLPNPITTRVHALQGLDPELRTTPKQMRSSLELQTAFASNSEYRKTALSQMQQARDDSPSPDAQSHPGYPDGGSILLGIPSRFLKQSSILDRSASAPKPRAVSRRKSSSSAMTDKRKPNLTRADTSPNIPPSLTAMSINTRPKSPMHGDLLSSRSTSSDNQAAFTATARRRSILSPNEPRSPPLHGHEHVSPSPARTLSHKTQSFLRRLSGSHGSDRGRHRQISPSPSRPVLPSLTSTPSSAYVNIIPKDLRRASGQSADATTRTSQAGPQPMATGAHVSTPTRVRAESEARHTTPSTDTIVEKRGFFGRRGSFKQMTGLERSKTVTPSGRGRRRSSVRDVITSGKRW